MNFANDHTWRFLFLRSAYILCMICCDIEFSCTSTFCILLFLFFHALLMPVPFAFLRNQGNPYASLTARNNRLHGTIDRNRKATPTSNPRWCNFPLSVLLWQSHT